MVETFHGYIETTQDVLLIFEGCRRGLLPRVCRRLQEKERRMIRSGSVFVFDERESGIKRWTDGLVWSPSRILGNFLIYRELDKKTPAEKKNYNNAESSTKPRSFSADQTAMGGLSASAAAGGLPDRNNRERRLVGSLSDSYRFRKNGLIKKTMSIVVNGVAQHLISYYLPGDIMENKLRTPSSVPELASLEISPDLLVKQNFRVPPMVEPSFDNNEGGLTAEERRMHSYRSMSMGSLRTSHSYALHSTLPPVSRSSIGQPQPPPPQLLYTTSSSSFNQRMDLEDTNHTNKYTNNNNLSAYYTSMYGNNANTMNNGFPPLPSPSSITSSPNTPILSPVRQSFSQQQQQARNYSISSASSNAPPPRYTTTAAAANTANRNGFDLLSNNNSLDSNSNNKQTQSIHPHMLPDVGNDNSNSDPNNNSSTPHIGQLLNPVHPLNTAGVSVKTEPGDAHASHAFYPSFGLSTTTTTTAANTASTAAPSSTPTTAAAYANHHQFTTHAPLPHHQQQQQQYGGTYYLQRPQQVQQPLANTHSLSANELYRNQLVLPQSSNSSMYDTQNASELGMGPLMLK